jgi:hypothetical protein
MTNSKRNKNNIPRNGSVVPVKNRRPNYGIARFNSVTDPVLVSAISDVSPTIATSDATGNASGTISINTVGVSGWNTTTNVSVLISQPRLNWLFNTSRNFGRYRILRANLIIVGSVASTVTGIVSIHSGTDFTDYGTGIGYVGPGGYSFDLASLSTKNKTIPLTIDSTWKKVTGVTTGVASGATYAVNSINDLACSQITWNITGAPASTSCFSMYIDYDIEFSNPMSIGYNR